MGNILVFVDADMTFDVNFIKDLTLPINSGKSIGTFSRNEFVKNKDNIWAVCWNINKNLPKHRMIPDNYPDRSPVFRAILKKEFQKVNGFDTDGQYTDDWSLSRKLKIKSTVAQKAVYFHSNPETLSEVFKQARWIGKNYFIAGDSLRRVKSLFLYNPLTSAIISIYKLVKFQNIFFPIFKFVYDLGIMMSVIGSAFGEPKYK